MTNEPKQPRRDARPATPAVTRPQRPVARPSAPTLASQPPAPLSPAGQRQVIDPLAELAAIAGTGIAPSAMIPRPATSASKPSATLRSSSSLRETVLPPSLMLGITLPILGIAWFVLDAHRVIRDNPFGVGLPIVLFVVGAAFLAMVAAMLLRAPKSQTSDGESR